MSNISLSLAFTAGVISFLSPCILPLVPGYLSYLAGVSVMGETGEINKRIIVTRAVFFNLGFMVVFVLLGATGSYMGKIFLAYKLLLMKIGGIIIFLMGLQMSGWLKWQLLYRTYQIKGRLRLGGSLGAFFLGITFAAGWTPCVGPVLASILVYASVAGTVRKGMLLLGCYSLGLAVPFMLAAISISWSAGFLRQLNQYTKYIAVAGGIVLMIVGGMLFLNIFPRLGAYLNF